MRTGINLKQDDATPKPAYIQRLPKRKSVRERKRVRQLLRAMLPMEEEQRQYQEEQKLYPKHGKAQKSPML